MTQNLGTAGKPDVGLVDVTLAMVEAGLDRLSDLRRDENPAYVVQAIYLAMEYERRSRD